MVFLERAHAAGLLGENLELATLQESGLMAVAMGVGGPALNVTMASRHLHLIGSALRRGAECQAGKEEGWPYGHLAFQRVTGAEGDE